MRNLRYACALSELQVDHVVEGVARWRVEGTDVRERLYVPGAPGRDSLILAICVEGKGWTSPIMKDVLCWVGIGLGNCVVSVPDVDILKSAGHYMGLRFISILGQ